MKTKALLLGILSSFFFAFTFIFNRSINLSGGYWLWSPALRYFFTLPIVFLLVLREGHLKRIISEIKSKPLPWLIWSTVGSGLFYLPLTADSRFGAG
ncbi:MAG: multidrug resistance efflux transporter family protein, partial [Oscillospiraceae bacterium]|nr:multidrug resistance efflux transporter family protein [Oscillospiraceae bacterium]